MSSILMEREMEQKVESEFAIFNVIEKDSVLSWLLSPNIWIYD